MTHSIDTSFKAKKQARLALRRRRLWLRLAAGFAVLAVISLGVGFYLTADYWSFGDEDEELHAVEGADDVPADASVYVPAIIDLAGDPMWITLAPDADTSSKAQSIARPAELDQAGVSPQIEILSDVMLSASEKFMTTIPSTQEDFAFFQAQRQTAPPPSGEVPSGDAPASDLQNELQPSPAAGEAPATAQPQADADDPEAGWGETIDAGEAALPAFQKTQIENTPASRPSPASTSASSDRRHVREDPQRPQPGQRCARRAFLRRGCQAGGRSPQKPVQPRRPGTGLCRRHAWLQADARDGDDVADAGFDLCQERLCRHVDAQRGGGVRIGCRPLGARRSVQLFGGTGGRHAQAAVSPARRNLFDSRAQQGSDRRDRRSDHVSVERTGPGCLRQRRPASGSDLFADAARQE
ncbi:hypothetical protein AJ88_27080 [Mesorhizobium amorphae CCBAU 01583]|nr:hypothetical protein AJ88_27080 [Mesorhizobium amorphae CCBAU 01583]